MSRRAKRTRVNHYDTAARAKAARGQWVRAGVYGSTYTAKSMGRFVRTGSGLIAHAYSPVGEFDARHEVVDDGTELWVRWNPAAGCDHLTPGGEPLTTTTEANF